MRQEVSSVVCIIISIDAKNDHKALTNLQMVIAQCPGVVILGLYCTAVNSTQMECLAYVRGNGHKVMVPRR